MCRTGDYSALEESHRRFGVELSKKLNAVLPEFGPFNTRVSYLYDEPYISDELRQIIEYIFIYILFTFLLLPGTAQIDLLLCLCIHFESRTTWILWRKQPAMYSAKRFPRFIISAQARSCTPPKINLYRLKCNDLIRLALTQVSSRFVEYTSLYGLFSRLVLVREITRKYRRSRCHNFCCSRAFHSRSSQILRDSPQLCWWDYPQYSHSLWPCCFISSCFLCSLGS